MNSFIIIIKIRTYNNYYVLVQDAKKSTIILKERQTTQKDIKLDRCQLDTCQIKHKNKTMATILQYLSSLLKAALLYILGVFSLWNIHVV